MTTSFDGVRRFLSFAAAVLMLSPLSMPALGHAASPEQRCTELGANCVCSEPLNTTTSNLLPGSNYAYNPTDSTTKECLLEGQAGAAFLRPAQTWTTASSGSSVLATLPPGHSVAHVFRGLEGHTGMFDVGSYFPATAPNARRAYRAYIYFSPNFEFSAGSSSCLNSGKLIRFSTVSGPYLSFNGRWHLNAFTVGWAGGAGVNGGCCSWGPGTTPDSPAQIALQPSQIRGKWHRIESVIENLGGTPIVLKIYWKNVTDNGPEYKIIDTSIPTAMTGVTGDPDWTATDATTLRNSTNFRDSDVEWFRNGTCAGFFAASHIMYAAWSTNAGQRIGPAYEIEGGEASPVPPAVPGTPVVR
jgi:hypothetical protein